MESPGSDTTLAGGLHGVLAGVGFTALAFVPLALMGAFKPMRGWAWFSLGAFVAGAASLVFFVISEDQPSASGILSYTGLWQRAFLLVHYVYLCVVAVRIVRLSRSALYEESGRA